MSIRAFIRRIFKIKKSNINGSIEYQGLNLPPFRTNQNLGNSEDYIKSAVEQLDHLKLVCSFGEDTQLLDFGCGQGRLVNGLKYSKTPLGNYYGVDTDSKSIEWCEKWITVYSPKYQFVHLPAHNARYNKTAENLQKLPFEKDQFDIIFLNSVFSHMLPEDLRFYLGEFYRTLKRQGLLYLTAFIEENVPDMEENPINYPGESRGALHRVRYEKSFFINLLEESGMSAKDYYHHKIKRTQQSVVIAVKK